jgi:hypothetical protein
MFISGSVLRWLRLPSRAALILGLGPLPAAGGFGAAHQTGWTELLANLVMRRYRAGSGSAEGGAPKPAFEAKIRNRRLSCDRARNRKMIWAGERGKVATSSLRSNR